MNSWQNLVEPIKADREHGASQLYSDLLDALTEYASHLSPDALDFSELAARVASVRPEMAPFHYAARRIGELADAPGSSAGKDELIDLVEQLKSETISTIQRIAPLLKERVRGSRSLMLHSYSGTLKSVVIEAVERNVKVLISEADPGKEGLKLAEDLRSEGFEVMTYPDSESLQRLAQADAVVVGADWIAEEYFVNKVGTLQLAEVAAENGIPFYVVSDRTKLVPSQYRKSDPLAATVGLFEPIPLKYVSAFLLPDGAYVPEQVAGLL